MWKHPETFKILDLDNNRWQAGNICLQRQAWDKCKGPDAEWGNCQTAARIRQLSWYLWLWDSSKPETRDPSSTVWCQQLTLIHCVWGIDVWGLPELFIHTGFTSLWDSEKRPRSFVFLLSSLIAAYTVNPNWTVQLTPITKVLHVSA